MHRPILDVRSFREDKAREGRHDDMETHILLLSRRSHDGARKGQVAKDGEEFQKAPGPTVRQKQRDGVDGIRGAFVNEVGCEVFDGDGVMIEFVHLGFFFCPVEIAEPF